MASTTVWLVVGLIVGLVVGIAIGYAVMPPKTVTVTKYVNVTTTTNVTTPVTTTTTVSTAPFAVGAAGTLKFAFGDILNVMQSMYPSITIAPAMFKGSGEVAHTEATTQQFSVVASADTTTIPSVLFPNYTNYEIAFGITQMVIIVDLNTTAGQEVYQLWQQAQSYPPLSAQYNETWQKIWQIIALNSSTVVGVSNPFTDPSGYQAQCVVKLAGLAFFNNASYLYNAIYGNPSKYMMRNTEIDLLTLMTSGQVDFILSAYESNAIPQTQTYHNTVFITLPPFVNLGNLSYVNYYHQVSVTWTENGVTKTFACNPVVYTITIPFQAPNKQAAEYFLLLLYSPIGQKILEENGIVPIIPGIVYGNYSAVPNAIKPFVAPLSQYPQYASIFPSQG
ncbi:ABC-type molybdate transport system periplasmic component-like protein [Vulcanisaeta moutnovskia 768-28]|uniref:ABC-type molybdate transport system periplasmic component-like protein n=1 Tax=Vulcanisaeta moutnovskia (strain 768-28) TaxID=985053 RepID=F0QUZ6_VULM7|nr:substrate-binding domain-containing protein [Vulcanisaeta moutnovskia]ADY01978.1 ABC-type molybdate transport system periplasmic component-like protein [Vulcanisaeta moutnovskia 768-28]